MATATTASKRKRPAPPSVPSVAELAEQWLTAKRALESAGQAAKGHSDRARRADLARWGRLLTTVEHDSGRADTGLDVATDLAAVSLTDLDTDELVAAVAAAKKAWSDATVARMLSTMRGFTRWLTRRQLLSVDPCDSELLRVSARAQRRPRAVEESDVEAMVAAALMEPTGRQQMFWPARDVALLRFLAGTGARAEEICGATIGEIDRRPERPIWRVGRSKGGKQRDVPLRRDTVDAVDHWLENRTVTLPGRAPGRSAPLFVRTDGSPLTERTLDRLLRAIALRAAVGLPAGAAAHAFRHHYGVTLALRGVPQPAISQLMGHADPRTTAIYTTVAASALIGVLDDAGLL
jgi:site-specific recombinase XerD